MVTPFCSCSAVPLLIGFLPAGAPAGVTFSLLIAPSLPERVILRKVLKPRLLAAFVGVVATGILGVGYVFNLVLA